MRLGFHRGVGAVAVLALWSAMAMAADKSLVFVSAGGTYQAAQEKAEVKPFTDKSGLTLVSDSGVAGAFPKIKAMEATGNVQWDVVSLGEPDYVNLTKNDLLEPVDYSRFDKATLDAIVPVFKKKYGVASVVFSYGIAYRTDLGRKDHPRTWAEFWDTEKFPGPRAITAGTASDPPWELALLADGVPPEKLYPIDYKRATASLDKIKGSVTLWYEDVAAGMQALINGDVDYAFLPNGRVLQAKSQGAPIDFEYNQAFLLYDVFVVPKNAPHKEAALDFVAFASQAEPGAALMKLLPYSAPNQDALKLLDPKYAKNLPTDPSNLPEQIPLSRVYYGETSSDGETGYQKSLAAWNAWYGQK
jgi:putative spermidine/putrescine transport system substrate-binding protein